MWPGGGPTGEDAGFNGVLARTQRGAELVQAAVQDGYLVLDQALTPRDMDAFQPHQVRKKQAVWARLQALNQAGKPIPNVVGLRIEELYEQNTAEENQKEIEGTLRRINQGQFDEPVPR